MNALINSEKMEEVAVLPLNLQFFSEEPTNANETEITDDAVETTDETVTDEQETGGNDSELANQKPVQDAETNAKFAEMRRQAEQAEARAKHADELIAQQYGESHGIYTVEQYEQALKEQQQAEERQMLESAGLPEDVINKLSKLDEILQRDQQRQEAEQQKQFNETMKSQIDELVKEHPDVNVKDIHELMNLPIYEQMHDKLLKGYSVLDAYESANRAELRTKALNQGKQTALNQINSKSHVRGNGGEGADDIDLTSVPADVMATYRQMFAKELRTGKMSEADFVKHYKKSQ